MINSKLFNLTILHFQKKYLLEFHFNIIFINYTIIYFFIIKIIIIITVIIIIIVIVVVAITIIIVNLNYYIMTIIY